MVELIVKSKVKEYAKTVGGVAISGDFYPELEKVIIATIDKALNRCKKASMNTLKDRHC